jgi:hypothetical protein
MNPADLTRLLLVINNHVDAYHTLPTLTYIRAAMGERFANRETDLIRDCLRDATKLPVSADNKLGEAKVLAMALDDLERLEAIGDEPDSDWAESFRQKIKDYKPN